MIIDDIKNIMQDKTAAIVAHGPSILNLRYDHFNNIDVAIVLNSAIIMTRKLNLNIPVFYMAKDAGKPDRRYFNTCSVCDFTCAKDRPIHPEILLVHEHESKLCFQDYKDRIVFNNSDFGLIYTRASLCSSIHICKLIGISKIKLFCFDAMVNGDTHEVVNDKIIDETYALYGHMQIKAEAMQCADNCGYTNSIEWIIPK